MSSQSTNGMASVEAQASPFNSSTNSAPQNANSHPFNRNIQSGGSTASPPASPPRQQFVSHSGFSTAASTTTGARYETYSIMGRGGGNVHLASPASSMMSGNRYLTQSTMAGTGASNRVSGVNFTTSSPGFRYRGLSSPSTMGQVCMQQSSVMGEAHVISERTVEHEVRVPKKVVREDIVEKVIVIPEKILHEEMVEDVTTVREKIIEVAKPIYRERIVEVPETEYIERIVEVPEIIYQEKVKEVPRIEYQERIIEVPKIITQERIVEIPEIQYIEVPVEKIVEVPEIREQVILKQIPITQYVDRPVPEYVTIEVEQEVFRNIPVPIEAVTIIQLQVPKLRPRYTRQDVPLYVPRFIEVVMPAEFMDAAAVAEAEHYAQQVSVIAAQTAVSICEVERLAGALKDLDEHYNSSEAQGTGNASSCMSHAWMQGRFIVANASDIPLIPSTVAGRHRDEIDSQQSVTNDDGSGLEKERRETSSENSAKSLHDEVRASTTPDSLQYRLDPPVTLDSNSDLGSFRESKSFRSGDGSQSIHARVGSFNETDFVEQQLDESEPDESPSDGSFEPSESDVGKSGFKNRKFVEKEREGKMERSQFGDQQKVQDENRSFVGRKSVEE